ncbi:glycosyltransferase family 2 protein [Vogesella indigofera]|uniref:glycosyltransferase family 2 protein n=1 Tax=Vogesella indigofera TaxID=45465 RepID=UPI003F431EEF
MPKVSIVVAAYNAAPFIADMILSVKNQIFEDWELVIVDDGSVDDTSAIVRKFAEEDSRIFLLKQKNAGAVIARNVAFSESRGEYIVILDADDRILPEKLLLQVGLLDAQPRYGVVYGDTWFCDDRMNRVELESKKYPLNHVSGDVFEKIVLGNLFAVHSAMVRRICIENVGLHDEEKEVIADWDFWVRVAERYCFFGHKEVVAEYRFHTAMSAKSDGAKLQLKQRVNVVGRIEKLERFFGLPRSVKGDFYFATARFAHKFGFLKEAFHYYVKAIFLFPLNWKAYVGCVFLIERRIKNIL